MYPLTLTDTSHLNLGVMDDTHFMLIRLFNSGSE